MSITTPTEHPRRRRPPGLDPAETPAHELFSEFIAENADLCPRCFRQQYDVDVLSEQLVEAHGDVLAARTVAVHDGVQEVTEHHDLVRTPEWTDRDYVPPKGRESGVVTRRQTICTCGDVDGAELRTRSKADAVDHAANLSALLDRWGVENDWLGLIRQVKLAKETPSYAANDALCFDLGVTHAVCRAREVDPKPALATVLDRY